MKAIYAYTILVVAICAMSASLKSPTPSFVDTYHKSLEAAVGQEVK